MATVGHLIKKQQPISEIGYDIFLAGKMPENCNSQRVTAALSKFLNIPREKVALLFRGKPIRIRKSLPKAQAQRWQQVCNSLGLPHKVVRSNSTSATKTQTNKQVSNTSKQSTARISPSLELTKKRSIPTKNPANSKASSSRPIRDRELEQYCLQLGQERLKFSVGVSQRSTIMAAAVVGALAFCVYLSYIIMLLGASAWHLTANTHWLSGDAALFGSLAYFAVPLIGIFFSLLLIKHLRIRHTAETDGFELKETHSLFNLLAPLSEHLGHKPPDSVRVLPVIRTTLAADGGFKSWLSGNWSLRLSIFDIHGLSAPEFCYTLGCETLILSHTVMARCVLLNEIILRWFNCRCSGPDAFDLRLMRALPDAKPPMSLFYRVFLAASSVVRFSLYLPAAIVVIARAWQRQSAKYAVEKQIKDSMGQENKKAVTEKHKLWVEKFDQLDRLLGQQQDQKLFADDLGDLVVRDKHAELEKLGIRKPLRFQLRDYRETARRTALYYYRYRHRIRVSGNNLVAAHQFKQLTEKRPLQKNTSPRLLGLVLPGRMLPPPDLSVKFLTKSQDRDEVLQECLDDLRQQLPEIEQNVKHYLIQAPKLKELQTCVSVWDIDSKVAQRAMALGKQDVSNLRQEMKKLNASIEDLGHYIEASELAMQRRFSLALGGYRGTDSLNKQQQSRVINLVSVLHEMYGVFDSISTLRINIDILRVFNDDRLLRNVSDVNDSHEKIARDCFRDIKRISNAVSRMPDINGTLDRKLSIRLAQATEGGTLQQNVETAEYSAHTLLDLIDENYLQVLGELVNLSEQAERRVVVTPLRPLAK